MATVEELLAAAHAQKSPLISLLEGLAGGFGTAQAGALDRLKSMVALKEQQDEVARRKKMSDLLMGRVAQGQEDQTQGQLDGIASRGKSPHPALRLEGASLGEDGFLKPQFKTVEPKPSKDTDFYSVPQAAALVGDKDLDLASLFPDGKVPKEYAHQLVVRGKADVTMGEKADQFYQKEFDKLVEKNNPTNGNSRSVIGMLGRTNMNAARAITTLQKPDVTNQEAGNVMADIAQIYQGGAPTEFGMSHQGYSTLYGNIQGLRQKVTGKPQDALPDEIKSRLLGVLNDMRQVNAGIIKQNFDTMEKAQARVINHSLDFRQQWKDFRSGVEGGIAPAPATVPAPSAPAGPQAGQVPIALTGDKARRLAELRSKAAAGGLR